MHGTLGPAADLMGPPPALPWPWPGGSCEDRQNPALPPANSAWTNSNLAVELVLKSKDEIW